MTWALDLDGVLWLGDTAIPGSAGAVAALQERGERVVFVTNNSNRPVADYVAKLERMGVAARGDDVITSAQAAARLVDAGSTVLVCAGPGVVEALEARGARVVEEGPADAVVVGWFKEFDYARLSAAARAVMGGARLIGTNDDATYPTADGPIPGGGSFLAAVAYASGAVPQVAGKPNQAMVDLVTERAGAVHTMVGDRPSTDGALAAALGARYVLVLTGVVTRDQLPIEPAPDAVAADLAAAVAGALGESPPP